MPAAPARPKIYHITHAGNLPAILAQGGLLSDAAMIQRGGPPQPVGMAEIKSRRLSLPVECYSGDHVGDYVPFYFCSRSVMLYMLHMGNHPGLTYTGGQGPLVHLEADLNEVVEWADSNQRQWAFTLSNAGARYTKFRNRLADLPEIDWPAVANNNFRSAEVKEGKQAEFLLHQSFPWHLVRRIGVHSMTVGRQVSTAIAADPHRPSVEVKRDWYF